MSNANRKRARRVRNLITISVLTAIVISVSTFAWFIGMRVVNVSSFDVEIASTESLLLSLDGQTWDNTVSISQSTLDDVSYSGHTNSWGGRGLIPMSSIGEMDSSVSRMILYEKASLDPTPGGYRLLASRVNNFENDDPEQEGYVVFDLFVKNISGNQYIEELNILDEESIYLTNDSEVTVAADGVANTGIENSVRVAFTQIGRVIATSEDQAKITGITCNPDGEGNPTVVDGVTGICREAQIWEPNDRDHVSGAINWYKTSCRKRVDVDVTLKSSYSDTADTCKPVLDGVAYPTYAVSKDIKSSDNVDVYDGAAYNEYTANEEILIPYDSFTDTEKLLTGTARPPFMKLAPNSITKVRIYIYIEGQDIDNYDFASIGKRISVKFGFTKERFTEDDFNYEGPIVNEGEGPNGEDRTKPIITLIGNDPYEINLGETFEDPGATATDATYTVDPENPEEPPVQGTKDLTDRLEVTGTVNTDVAGTYTVTYKVTDDAGNVATKTRTVVVKEVQEP